MKWRWLLILLLPVMALAAPAVTPPPGQLIGTVSPCGANQFAKTVDGVWECVNDPGAGTGAPTDATYIVQIANATLTAEQILASLSTGLVIVTNTTGVLSVYGGSSCTNQFPRSANASGAFTCASVALTDLGFDPATQTELDAHINDSSAAHAATAIGFTPAGTIAGDDAQEAIEEVASEAASALSTHEADTTDVHGITDTAALVLTTDTRLPSMTTPSALSTSSQITCATPTVYVAGSGGAVTITSNPSIIAGTYNGQRCLLVGSHATNTVTLSNGNTIRLPGNTGTLTIGLNLGSPEFVWTGAEWVLASLPRTMAKQTGPVVTMTACGDATNPVHDGGSGNKIEFCLTGTTPTIKMLCSGAECSQTAITNMVLAISGAKPTCDATLAPTDTLPMWVVTGGAGVATAFQVCTKNALDVYAWRSITLP